MRSGRVAGKRPPPQPTRLRPNRPPRRSAPPIPASKPRLPVPRTPGFELLAISDRRAVAGGALEPWFLQLGAAGVGAVQIREKDLSDRALLDLARSARSLLPPETALLINGRADIARGVGADRVGVHLPGSGLPVAALRARFGRDLLIGRSTHTLEEIEAARDEGAHYATFGPVYPTPSK